MSRSALCCMALIALVTAVGCPGDGSELIDDMMTGPMCGDGILDPGEECDDGNLVDGDDCNATCIDETATLAYIQANIFIPICTPGCHVVGGIGPMSLESEAISFQNLVNVQSGAPSRVRVAPGDPESSELVWRIDGRSVPQMPLFRPQLEQEEMDSIINWIANGANP